jgi:hypothetical protein
MRPILLLLSLTWLGCTSALNLPDDDAGAGAGGDGGGGGAVDLASGPDLGPVGASCKTACDCQAGLACVMNKCTMSMLGALYCCESAMCPMGGFCQSGMGGGFQRCGGGMGNRDGGMGNRDFGFGNRDFGFGNRDGGFGNRDFGPRDSGTAVDGGP